MKRLNFFIVRHWRIISAIGALFPIFLIYCYRSEIKQFFLKEGIRDSYFVEISAGLVIWFIPIMIALILGKKMNEYEFYHRISKILDSLKKMREQEMIKDGEIIRHLVKTTVRNFGNSELRDKIAAIEFKKYEKENHPEAEMCKVCNLKAEVVVEGKDKKCKYCKLNCFAWDFDSMAKEERELRELKRNLKNKKKL